MIGDLWRQYLRLSPQNRRKALLPPLVALGSIALAMTRQTIPWPTTDALAVFHESSAESQSVRFVDHAEKFGIQHRPTEHPQATFIERMEFVSSVAIADLNRDDWPDLVFSNGSSERFIEIYINRKGLSFERLDSAALQLDHPSHPNGTTSSVLAADFDLNGTTDVLVVRKSGCLWMLSGDGTGRFHREPVYAKRSPDDLNQGLKRVCGRFLSANLADLNLDGRIDVILHARSSRSPLILPDITSNQVLINSSDGWHDETAHWLGKNSDFTWGSLLFYHKPGSRRPINIDDGAKQVFGPDLYLINDFQRPRFYRWQSFRYEERTGRVVPSLTKHGQMGGDTSDLGGEDSVSLYVTNVSRPRSPRGYNYLFRSNPKSPLLDETARELSVDRCGFGWGAKFLDVNNDGRRDLIATNGIIKGKPIGQNNQIRDRQNWYYYLQVLTIPDFLYDKSLIDIQDSVSGAQRNCLFLQNSNGMFSDIALAAGVRDQENGRGVAVADLNRDGKLDFIIANNEAPPNVYINETEVIGNWLSLEIRGSRHATPIGSVIRLTTHNGTTRYEHFPANGFAGQNEDRIHFGIGDATVASARIYFPATRTELKFEDLAANQNHVIQFNNEPRSSSRPTQSEP